MLSLSAPKEATWVVGVIAGGLGILAQWGGLSIGVAPVVLLLIGFVVLAVATAVRGL
jgi:hypothetical protein